MRTIFATITTVLAIGFAGPAFAGPQTHEDCYDPRYPGGYLAVDGQCHTADDIDKFAPKYPIGSAVDDDGIEQFVDKHFRGTEQFEAFLKDCEANGGKVYTAEDWNKRGIQPRLNPGQMQCYRDPSWN
jgi:hypothetical protein